MLAIPPSYGLPVVLVFIGIVSLFHYAPIRERLHPQRLLVLALVAALVCIPVYSINAQQASAYDVGDVVVAFEDWNLTIGPSEVERIDDISNIHTLAGVYLTIVCDSNVTFYLIDQNRPETHYLEANYSDDSVNFVLPYLYTETGVPARWSMCFKNPNPDSLNVSIQAIWREDSIEIAWWKVQFSLYLPLALLLAIWLALGTPLLVIYRKQMVSQGFATGSLLTALGIALGLILVLIVPSFILTPHPLAVLAIVALVLLFREKKKETPAGPNVDIE